MKFSKLFTSLLLGASVTLARPVDDVSDLENREEDLERKRRPAIDYFPEHPRICPARAKEGQFGPFDEHQYTAGYIKKTFVNAVQLAAADQTRGDGNWVRYPHTFANREKLPFNCGRQLMEFPITLDGESYNGGNLRNIPDRVVFEYHRTKTHFYATFCGVVRHGRTEDFLLCRIPE